MFMKSQYYRQERVMQQIGSIRTLPSWAVLIRESGEHGGISGIFDSPNRMWARIFSIFSETNKHFEKKTAQHLYIYQGLLLCKRSANLTFRALPLDVRY